jgi:hypothetical protein
LVAADLVGWCGSGSAVDLIYLFIATLVIS